MGLRTIMTLAVGLILCVGSVSSLTNTVQFGKASFKTEMWINDKEVFKKPKGVDVEFVGAGAFDWVIADAKGKKVRTVREENLHGGWHSIDFPSLGLFSDYSIGFRNASTNEQEIKGGEVQLR